MSDPFGLLGVAPGASTAEIKAAFRRRALECHPDIVATAPPAVQAAKAAEYASVVEAYERLTTRGAASSSATATRSQQQYSHTSSAYYRADIGKGRYRTTATASAKQSFSNFARNSWQNGGLVVLGGVFFVGLMVCEPFIDAWWESRNEGKLFKHVAAERKRCR